MFLRPLSRNYQIRQADKQRLKSRIASQFAISNIKCKVSVERMIFDQVRMIFDQVSVERLIIFLRHATTSSAAPTTHS